MTLNEQKYLFEHFAAIHPMVGESLFSPEYLINGNKDLRLPLLWFFCDSTQLNEQSRIDSFAVTIMDRINEDWSNLDDILSDCKQIADDLMSYLIYHEDEQKSLTGEYYNYTTRRLSSYSPGIELTNNHLAGWSLRIEFESPITYDYCAIPDGSPAVAEEFFLLIDDTHFMLIDDTHFLRIQ